MPRHKVSGNIDLNVHVLTMGHWPTYTPMEIQLPAEVSYYAIVREGSRLDNVWAGPHIINHAPLSCVYYKPKGCSVIGTNEATKFNKLCWNVHTSGFSYV